MPAPLAGGRTPAGRPSASAARRRLGSRAPPPVSRCWPRSPPAPIQARRQPGSTRRRLPFHPAVQRRPALPARPHPHLTAPPSPAGDAAPHLAMLPSPADGAPAPPSPASFPDRLCPSPPSPASFIGRPSPPFPSRAPSACRSWSPPPPSLLARRRQPSPAPARTLGCSARGRQPAYLERACARPTATPYRASIPVPGAGPQPCLDPSHGHWCVTPEFDLGMDLGEIVG